MQKVEARLESRGSKKNWRTENWDSKISGKLHNTGSKGEIVGHEGSILLFLGKL